MESPDVFAVASPVGPLRVGLGPQGIEWLDWAGGGAAPESAGARAAARQLGEYFDGCRTAFDLALAPASGFAATFRAALLAIPFGETRTYGDLARDLGASAQAIGQACGANRIPIIVPCHRVLSASGLGGFSGGTGIETKVALLRHEGAAGLLI